MDCPACADLRCARQLLARPHGSLRLTAPETIAVLDSSAGALLLERRNEPSRAIALIALGVCVIALMLYVGLASGTETLWFVVPLVLASLAGIGVGARELVYRQRIALSSGTVTVTGDGASTSVRDIEQLIVEGTHVTLWHKGLRWHSRFRLLARSRGASVPLISGSYDEVRFVEAGLEAALGITDDPSRNALTTSGH